MDSVGKIVDLGKLHAGPNVRVPQTGHAKAADSQFEAGDSKFGALTCRRYRFGSVGNEKNRRASALLPLP